MNECTGARYMCNVYVARLRHLLLLLLLHSATALWLPIPLKVFVVLHLPRRMLNTRVSDTISFHFS